MRVWLLLLMLPSFAFADFETKAKTQSDALKKGLLAKLTEKIKEKGVVKAVEFCHEEALPLTGELESHKLKMGRTSFKFRNPKNAPEEWIKPYLEAAKGTNPKSPFKEQVIVLKDGAKFFLSPLYVAPQCLQCHGNPSGELGQKIKQLYPNDLATGYKPGEFRGFVWVKE